MNNVKFVLRQLPGVSDIESLLDKIEEHPNHNWAPENDQLEPIVDRVSKDLFGITEAETGHEYDDNISYEEWLSGHNEWEANFSFAENSDDDKAEGEQETEEIRSWEALGWDVTDGSGEILVAVAYLQRQIICAAKGLRGRLPGAEITEAEAKERASAWGVELLKRKPDRAGA